MNELPLKSPIPILQQPKSKITTNPLIQPKISPTTTTTSEPLNNDSFSKSLLGFLDDLLNKPDNISWIRYLPIIIKKDVRPKHLGIFVLIISMYIILMKNNNVKVKIKI